MLIMFGLHKMPWIAFDESVNRYRVIGPFFSDEVSSAAPARTVLATRHGARIIGVEPSWLV